MRLRQLFEAPGESVGLIFGRFNPPHQGHKNAWKMASENTNWYIGTNESTIGPKDPLPAQVKRIAMETIMPEAKGHIEFSQSWYTLAAEVFAKHPKATLKLYTDEKWVADSLPKYNGQEGPHGFFNFENIEWVKKFINVKQFWITVQKSLRMQQAYQQIQKLMCLARTSHSLIWLQNTWNHTERNFLQNLKNNV